MVDGWESGVEGGPPLGDPCDFLPCDQYNNYGLILNAFAEEFSTPIYCWNSCETPQTDYKVTGYKVKSHIK